MTISQCKYALIAAIGGIGLSLGACAQSDVGRVSDKPNIIVILADDAGYADFGFQGSADIQTPNIDRLAAMGRTYTNAYVTTPFCSPSRAGLLSGRYTQRFGYEFNLTHNPPAGVDGEYMGLAIEESTIGDRLQERGYKTITVGKWHVGSLPQFHPNARGFDEFYGFLGGGNTYHPSKMSEPSRIERNGESVLPKAYLTDDFTREAVDYIEQYKDEPFFLYLAYNAVHTPMDVLQADMARFSGIEDPQRQRLAAMSWAMDRGVGQIMEVLEDNDLIENTIVIFTNDNGGDKIGIAADNTPLRGTKGTLLEGGLRVPLIISWLGTLKEGQTSDRVVSLLDVLPTALEVAGGDAVEELDGVSLLSDVDGSERSLFWRYDNMAAMRSGDWKLLRYPDRPAELYDLSSDPAELTNLASSEDHRLRLMMKSLFAWEGEMIHARWNTGTFWSQEDVRRYSDEHVASANAQTREGLSGSVE